jgi:hypothetical protein
MDLNFIEEHAAEFISELESLLGRVYSKLPVYSETSSGKDSSDANTMKNKFAELKTSIESMDVKAIKNSITELDKLKLPEEINNSVQNIYKKILMAEYDEALKLTEYLLQEGTDGK